MTSQSVIQTHSQSCALEECQEALNAPPAPTPGGKLLEEGEFLSFSNQHTPECTAQPDPSMPTAGPCPPNSSGLYSTEDRFSNTIPILDYVRTSWMSREFQGSTPRCLGPDLHPYSHNTCTRTPKGAGHSHGCRGADPPWVYPRVGHLVVPSHSQIHRKKI